MTTSETVRGLARPVDRHLARLLYPAGSGPDDFLGPDGEEALVPAASVSWRVFGNPLSVFVGGVAAVVLELAEPRVRSGVWEHTSFRERPLPRLQRTGHAAMMTVYGPRSRAIAMIAGVNRRHYSIAGNTPSGTPYRASEPELLAWVQATASFGFLAAYEAFVAPLEPRDRDRFYAEGVEAGRLYGVPRPPADERELEALFERMRPLLEPSDIVHEFLRIAGRMPLLPWPLRPVQGVLARAAVHCLPAWTRALLGLEGPRWRLARWQLGALRVAARRLERLELPRHPATLARRRLALR
jgi:uncharacterized protein (DUF2236 family)